MSIDVLLQQIVNGLVVGSVYALVALGYTMVYGILQLINFAHGEIVMIGGLTALVTAKWLLGMGAAHPCPAGRDPVCHGGLRNRRCHH